jgi:eukaryotic-like serine/threonine-protein kinase
MAFLVLRYTTDWQILPLSWGAAFAPGWICSPVRFLLNCYGMSPLAIIPQHAWNDSGSLTGNDVEGRYRIGRRLGKGASGVVYEARSLAPALADHRKRHVALKILSGDSVGDPDAVARFTHEAFLSSRLRHPNLVRVIDFGFLEEGRPYFAMELCRGATLDRVLAEAGTLPPAATLRLLEDTARALAVLHAHGIVHRDVKPSNLFVTSSGRKPRARLLDLGVAGVFNPRLAKKLGSVNVGARGTYGTPAYIAPEQVLGAETDGRTDVYALACVAYRALTGFEPFRGRSITATVRAHLFEVARPATALNPALPSTVDEVLERGMAKDRDARTESVERLIAELRVALGDMLR